jgi:hypothetical protein
MLTASVRTRFSATASLPAVPTSGATTVAEGSVVLEGIAAEGRLLEVIDILGLGLLLLLSILPG